MATVKCGQAVIIGGSIAGMCAARAVSDFYQKVIIIERDPIFHNPDIRPGVPQSRHLHAILLKGLQIMQDLFPELEAELDRNNIPEVIDGIDFRMLFPNGWSPLMDLGLKARSCTRPMLESAIRKQVSKIPQIEIIDRAQVDGPILDDQHQKIIGVRIRENSGRLSQIHADLLIDASGRHSRSAQWLADLNFGIVQESIVNAFWGYASRMYEIPSDFKKHWKGIYIMNKAPDFPRMGIALPMEDNRWLVNLAGVMKDYPPSDEDGFLRYAKSLRSPEIYDAIRSAKPLSPIYEFRHTANRRKYFENLQRWPERFLVMGDSLCAFNPVYGQGMSVCALEAQALQKFLAVNGNFENGAAKKFQKKIASIVEPCWMLATGEDHSWPGTQGAAPNKVMKVMQWYVHKIIALAPTNPLAFLRFK
ncbi:MAG TPA: FAD-dependent monooxygenase, partial [Acidobacteriota bacterium]